MTNGCTAPIALASLVDYWAGALAEDEEARLEEHVFACDDCSRRLHAVAALARGVAGLARRRGGLRMGLTQALARRLASEGLKIREYRAAPGESVNCGVGRDDDLIVTRLEADLSGVEHADLVFRVGDQVFDRVSDVAIDRAAGSVMYSDAADAMRAWPAMTISIQLIAVEGTGERIVSEYTFEHAGVID